MSNEPLLPPALDVGGSGRLGSAPPQPRFFTIRQVAAMLGVHYTTIMKQLNNRKMKGIKVGRQWRIHEDDLIEYLQPADPTSRDKVTDDDLQILQEHGLDESDITG